MTNSADPDQLLLQKPTDLDLHCLLRQGMSCSAREGLNTSLANSSVARLMLGRFGVYLFVYAKPHFTCSVYTCSNCHSMYFLLYRY